MENNNVTKNCTYPTFEEEKVVLACYGTFAAIAVLFHVTAVVTIVRTRAYRHFHHRLTLYMTIGGILRTVAFVLQVLPVDIDVPNTDTVTVRKGWKGVCVLGGFMSHHAAYIQTFTVVWTCVIVFGQVVHFKKARLKHEIPGVLIVILAPFLFSWAPFITNSYGHSGTRCWIVDEDCHNSYDLAFALAMATNVVPNLLLSLMGLTLIGWAIFVLIAKLIGKTFEHYLWIAMKEILPLAIYPTVYMLILLGRIVGLSSGVYSNEVSLSFMALTQLSSCALPLSLLVRPGIRDALCHSKEESPLTTDATGNNTLTRAGKLHEYHSITYAANSSTYFSLPEENA